MLETEVASLRDFLLKRNDYIPQLSVDCVVFSCHEKQLKVLLVQPKGMEAWALPGGFVSQNEDIESAAQETLKERTGLTEVRLDLFQVFGKASRNTQDSMRAYFLLQGIAGHEFEWLMKRFVTVGYYALVNFLEVRPTPSVLANSCTWFDISRLPLLAFDHSEIIRSALDSLRKNLDSKLLSPDLLPALFTMNELQVLYETALGTPLRRNNFQRRILGLDLLERTDKRYTGGAHKAPYLYRLKEKR
ncbi:MAG: NUDIX domain-containing protein [Bacteroidetes bacterium]|nr:MAG: NUDIX domain-containing protein [Bacteroidota bacterium]